jgi:hypothetical protein
MEQRRRKTRQARERNPEGHSKKFPSTTLGRLTMGMGDRIARRQNFETEIGDTGSSTKACSVKTI